MTSDYCLSMTQHSYSVCLASQSKSVLLKNLTKVYQSTFGQCPNNIKAKSMWKIGDDKFFNKDSQIESFDTTALVITGYNNEGVVDFFFLQ